MNCKNCGNEIKSDYKYCKTCGAVITPNDQDYFNQVHNTNNTKKKNVFLISVFIILIVAGIFVLINMLTKRIFNAIQYEYDNYVNQTDEDIKENGSYHENSQSDGEWLSSVSEKINSENTSNTYENPAIENTESKESVRLLTFLLSFSDVKMTSDTTDWYDILYGQGYYGEGSVNDYFRESSSGIFSFVPVQESWGTANDGIIDITLNMKHPSFNFTRNEDDYYEEGFELFEKVLYESDNYVDYSIYDYNNDGYIEPEELTIVFVFSGYETYEEFNHDISTYSCSLIYDYYAEADGMNIDECIYVSEKDPYSSNEQIMGIGILCHELGHALDLPDLYDTDYSSEGLGFHSLMAGGFDNTEGYEPYGILPAPLTAWEREYLGFEEPVIISSDGTYNVYSRSDKEYNILKIDEGSKYYLIENVDFNGFGRGLKDYLKSPGIAIWLVDKSVVENSQRIKQNDVNDNDRKYGVTLMEAYDTNTLSKRNFDYNKVYDHYYYQDGDSIFITDGGVTIEILDNPQNIMKVKITYP